MANDEHLALLRQGSATWNEWRKRNPEVKLDFREADLSMADLIAPQQGKPPRDECPCGNTAWLTSNCGASVA